VSALPTLDRYGAACRCLLRLREDSGAALLPDGTFIARHLARFPAWQDRPGETDLLALLELARELGLAATAEVYRDYDRVAAEHRAGRSVLAFTERAPRQTEPASAPLRFATVVVAMDPTAFTLWRPYPSGLSDVLPPAPREWWDRWCAVGLVLSRAPSPR
jgi:hypothetical protein